MNLICTGGPRGNRGCHKNNQKRCGGLRVDTSNDRNHCTLSIGQAHQFVPTNRSKVAIVVQDAKLRRWRVREHLLPPQRWAMVLRRRRVLQQQMRYRDRNLLACLPCYRRRLRIKRGLLQRELQWHLRDMSAESVRGEARVF